MEARQAKDRYLHALERRHPSLPDWAEAIRRRGAQRFAKTEWPHHRQEAWRFTDLTPVVEGQFELDGPRVDLQHADIRDWALDEADAELVFVDGHYAPGLSRYRTDPTDPTDQPYTLSAAILAGNPVLRKHLDAHVDATDAFLALNAAFLGDGAFVHIPKATDAGLIHVLHVSTGKQASHPRNLVVLDRAGSCRLVETYAGIGANAYLTNAVTEVVISPNARLDYVKLVDESDSAYHLGTTQVIQARASSFHSNTITLGGRISRSSLNVALDGEAAESLLRGLYLADGRRLADNALFVDHARPGCLSRVVYRGILDGSGRAVYTGIVTVERGAQTTDSNQVNNNLVLSDSAQIDTKPQLRILADDVKCTHGATVGQPSPDAIYYFKTRGIDEALARRMLTCGFAAEILAHLQVKSLKDRLTQAVFEKFSGKQAEV
ncbi:MAG: Fe-S cluster assembly protein SufD [Candidatus Hydrogenedentes bacterium]|nr:Fe-S cluster assembly protein SufD [Candidatus Hydrogenedentota bacterium]